MAFDGREGEWINMETASVMTKDWREGGNGAIKGGFFGREKLEALLAQSGAEGIRIYYGVNDQDQNSLVLVAADAEENDMTDKILDTMRPCPIFCGSGNGLNGNI